MPARSINVKETLPGIEAPVYRTFVLVKDGTNRLGCIGTNYPCTKHRSKVKIFTKEGNYRKEKWYEEEAGDTDSDGNDDGDGGPRLSGPPRQGRSALLWLPRLLRRGGRRKLQERAREELEGREVLS